MSCIEMPQCSLGTNATAEDQCWVLTHTVQVDTEACCAFVLLDKKTLFAEAGNQKSFSPPEIQLGEASILEMAGKLPGVKPSILSEGGMCPWGSPSLCFLAGDRCTVTLQIFICREMFAQ